VDLRDLIALAWKRRWVVLGVFAITLVASAPAIFSRPTEYESTAVVALTPDVKQGQGLVASDSLSALLATYAETAKSSINLARAEKVLGRKLNASIDTSTEGGSGILRITARTTDPRDAAAAAAATAQAFQDSITDNKLMIATLVDPASPEFSPVQPRPPLLLGVAALLGLFGGVLLAVALEQFRRRIDTAADVAQHTLAPVLGRLGRQRTLARATASVIWDQTGVDDLQESYRALRTNLEFLMDETTKVIEITSPEAAQGKSTVVANLAVAFSRIGIETIVLDADLRRPRQHEIFGLDNRSGLSTTLALGHKPELKRIGPGLSVITSGPVPPDPTEMLHIRLPSVIKALRRRNALILIDTPPVLPVSDARLVAPLTDGVILLATAGTQKPATFQAALDRLALVDTRLLGVILNKAGQEDVDTGSYYRYEATAETAERLEAERVEAERRKAARRSEEPPATRDRPAQPARGTSAPPVEQV
jgi:capsular exopolysaccharide synthesis family protein